MPSLAMKVWVSCLNRYGCGICEQVISIMIEGCLSYVSEDDLRKRSAYSKFVSQSLRIPHSVVITHHDPSRGRSPSRRLECIHCAQPMPVSLLSSSVYFRVYIFCGAVRRTYIVEGTELGGGLVQAGVGREDGAASLTLVPNNTTHGDDGVVLEGRSMKSMRSMRSQMQERIVCSVLGTLNSIQH